jgi:ASC-1-like (ASCH) protein
MSKVHDLKIEKRYLDLILSGKKTFEIRKNDRDFKEGDFLVLRDIHPASFEYMGRALLVEVVYLTEFEQKEGYVVMGIKEQADHE